MRKIAEKGRSSRLAVIISFLVILILLAAAAGFSMYKASAAQQAESASSAAVADEPEKSAAEGAGEAEYAEEAGYTDAVDYDSRVDVEPADYEYVSEYYARSNGPLRIRSGPGLGYSEITELYEARLLVLAVRNVYEPSLTNGDEWGYVQYFDNGGGYGWCYLPYTHPFSQP